MLIPMGTVTETQVALIERLRALCPKVDVGSETTLVYLEALSDIPDEALVDAFTVLARTWTQPYSLPMPAHIRGVVAERTLGLPSSVAAWDQAERYCFRTPTTIPCEHEDCDSGFIVHVGADAEDGYLPPVERCPACNGAGRYEINVPEVHPMVRRAIEHVGGWYTIRTTERIDTTRREFMRAYEQIRDDELRNVTLGRAMLPAEAAA